MTGDHHYAASRSGSCKALPIGSIDWESQTIVAEDGMVLRPYGADGTWVPEDALKEGVVRYLGSATHGGHIELKALYILHQGEWENLITGARTPLKETMPLYKRKD